MDKKTITATGHRKRAIAQIKMTPGSGKITVNGVDVNEYMPYQTLVMDLTQPLVITNNLNRFDIDVKVVGGGFSGQTGAIRLGITRDPRVKERKKYGLKKARRAPQFSKR